MKFDLGRFFEGLAAVQAGTAAGRLSGYLEGERRDQLRKEPKQGVKPPVGDGSREMPPGGGGMGIPIVPGWKLPNLRSQSSRIGMVLLLIRTSRIDSKAHRQAGIGESAGRGSCLRLPLVHGPHPALSQACWKRSGPREAWSARSLEPPPCGRCRGSPVTPGLWSTCVVTNTSTHHREQPRS